MHAHEHTQFLGIISADLKQRTDRQAKVSKLYIEQMINALSNSIFSACMNNEQ